MLYNNVRPTPRTEFLFDGPRCSGKSAWLRAASELKGLARRLIVYPRGPVLKTPDGIEVLPFHEFSALLSTGDLWQR